MTSSGSALSSSQRRAGYLFQRQCATTSEYSAYSTCGKPCFIYRYPERRPHLLYLASDAAQAPTPRVCKVMRRDIIWHYDPPINPRDPKIKVKRFARRWANKVLSTQDKSGSPRSGGLAAFAMSASGRGSSGGSSGGSSPSISPMQSSCDLEALPARSQVVDGESAPALMPAGRAEPAGSHALLPGVILMLHPIPWPLDTI